MYTAKLMMLDLNSFGSKIYDFYLYYYHPFFNLYEYSSFKYIFTAKRDSQILKTIVYEIQ